VSWTSSGTNGDVREEEEGAAATRGQEERARVPGRGLPRWVKRAEHARGARAPARRKDSGREGFAGRRKWTG
jgi:hypothetical protein